jgi:hypothetical protein
MQATRMNADNTWMFIRVHLRIPFTPRPSNPSAKIRRLMSFIRKLS